MILDTKRKRVENDRVETGFGPELMQTDGPTQNTGEHLNRLIDPKNLHGAGPVIQARREL